MLFIKWQWHGDCLQKKATVFSKAFRTLIFFFTRKRPPIWYVKIQVFTISWNLFPFKLTSFNCQCTTVRYKQYQSIKLIIIFQHFTFNDKTHPQTFVAPLQTDIPVHYGGGDGRQILLWKGKSIQLFIKSGDMSAPPPQFNWSVCQHCVYWIIITYNQVRNRIINIAWYTASNRWHTDVHLQIWFTYSKREINVLTHLIK